jgi:hypothetical protein
MPERKGVKFASTPSGRMRRFGQYSLVSDAFGGRGGIAQYNRDFLSLRWDIGSGVRVNDSSAAPCT